MKARKRITQRQAIFYQLLCAYAKDKEKFTPTHELQGEVYVPEMNLYGFVSYEVGARMSELRTMNPDLFQFIEVPKRGVPGHYYAHSFYKNALPSNILDPEIREFYYDLLELGFKIEPSATRPQEVRQGFMFSSH